MMKKPTNDPFFNVFNLNLLENAIFSLRGKLTSAYFTIAVVRIFLEKYVKFFLQNCFPTPNNKLLPFLLKKYQGRKNYSKVTQNTFLFVFLSLECSNSLFSTITTI